MDYARNAVQIFVNRHYGWDRKQDEKERRNIVYGDAARITGKMTVVMKNEISRGQPQDIWGGSSGGLEAADGRRESSASPSRSSSDKRAFSTGGVLCDRNCGVPSVGIAIVPGDGGSGCFTSSSNSGETSDVGVGGTYAT